MLSTPASELDITDAASLNVGPGLGGGAAGAAVGEPDADAGAAGAGVGAALAPAGRILSVSCNRALRLSTSVFQKLFSERFDTVELEVLALPPLPVELPTLPDTLTVLLLMRSIFR